MSSNSGVNKTLTLKFFLLIVMDWQLVALIIVVVIVLWWASLIRMEAFSEGFEEGGFFDTVFKAKEGVEKVGHDIKKTGEKAKDGLEKAGKKIKKTADQVKEKGDEVVDAIKSIPASHPNADVIWRIVLYGLDQSRKGNTRNSPQIAKLMEQMQEHHWEGIPEKLWKDALNTMKGRKKVSGKTFDQIMRFHQKHGGRVSTESLKDDPIPKGMTKAQLKDYLNKVFDHAQEQASAKDGDDQETDQEADQDGDDEGFMGGAPVYFEQPQSAVSYFDWLRQELQQFTWENFEDGRQLERAERSQEPEDLRRGMDHMDRQQKSHAARLAQLKSAVSDLERKMDQGEEPKEDPVEMEDLKRSMAENERQLINNAKRAHDLRMQSYQSGYMGELLDRNYPPPCLPQGKPCPVCPSEPVLDLGGSSAPGPALSGLSHYGDVILPKYVYAKLYHRDSYVKPEDTFGHTEESS